MKQALSKPTKYSRAEANPPLLAVCGSLKPAIGRNEPSACRELLRLALAPIFKANVAIKMLDLREMQLPPFDGREPWDYGHMGLVNSRAMVEAATGYVFSVPAYWGGIGSGFKNFIETVCGPGYGGGFRSPFSGRSAAVLVVGSDLQVAQVAATQIGDVFDSLGLGIICNPVILGNPHDFEESARAVQQLQVAAASVVLAQTKVAAVKGAAHK